MQSEAPAARVIEGKLNKIDCRPRWSDKISQPLPESNQWPITSLTWLKDSCYHNAWRDTSFVIVFQFTHTHAHIHARTRTHTHTHICARVGTHTYTYARAHAHTQPRWQKYSWCDESKAWSKLWWQCVNNLHTMQTRYCTCNVTKWRVRVTTVAVETQQCILSIIYTVYSLI
jgi:hypothetical protein